MAWTETPSYTGKQYRLRASTPIPTKDEGIFVLQTFMAEYNDIEVYLAVKDVPISEDFRGQGGDFFSANFKRELDVGGKTFSGNMVRNPVIIEEDDPGVINPYSGSDE